ncbi:MAG: type IX secretion system sortase PorU [Bacteroidetes bacterium]|nr:type IX secretion system sortase PorU [Bacteroidota bacterium]
MRKYIFLLFIIVVGFSVSDVQKEQITLNWVINLDNPEQPVITFENAFFDDNEPFIPIFSRVSSLKGKNQDVKYVIENPVFVESQIIFNSNTILSEDIQVESQKIVSGGNQNIHLKITPVKKVGDKIFLLKSFDLKKIPSTTKSTVKELVEWKDQSVLKSGKWIKISTSEKGIYKIPYSKLAEWGFPNATQVNVFGSGGALLSENPGNINYNDLNQNSVWHGANNGIECLFFYAQGTIDWLQDSSGENFKHSINHYTKEGYYFLTDEVGSPKIVELFPEVTESATHQISSFNSYVLHEKELVNVLQHGSGKQWFGESFRNGSSSSAEVNLADVDNSKVASVRLNTIGRSYQSSEFEVLIDDKNVGVINFNKVNTDSQTALYADEKEKSFFVNPNGNILEIQLNYLANSIDNNASGWLDFIEVNYHRFLKTGNVPVHFRDVNSVGEGNIVEFSIENSSSGSTVIDVSDPSSIKEIPLQLSGSVASFKRPAEELQEYVVFNSTGTFLEPVFVEEVENQNLHGISTPEFVIISHPGFLNSANNLADFHRSYDGMSVEVVSSDQVFNEFSSGTKNATGIRNFFKMLYDRGSTLKYVLLLGDGSFDNRNIRSENKNFIPTFQSDNSLSPTSSFVTDDYFVILDADESVYNGAVDLGIGRIPASTVFEAELVVDKIINYYSTDALGDWKNVVCFIGDDEDGNLHMKDSEKLAGQVNANHREFVTDKIYFDSYKEEATPAGEQYPGVTEAINNRVKEGVLVLNYVGHANNRFMADERVLDISNVNTWSNADHLPIFVTATCEFSRFDADETSIGEYVLFNPNGGGIGLFSTTRVVFAYSNYLLSRSFYEYIFEKDENGKRYRMGDIMRLAKVNTINTTNKRNFSLLGDPALKLSYPSNKVVTTAINGHNAESDPDTIGALQTIEVEGYVADFSNNKLNDFSGEITLTIYDKEIVMETLGNGGETPMNFTVQENIIYKGLASVNNGNFSFSFVVPKDIAYNLGNGKIIYYATNNTIDAGGAFENFVIGGSSETQIPDNSGPDIQLFMDSPAFVNGGETSKSPTLIAYLSDENGINTVGSGIGHDITAVFDNDFSNVLVLNDSYQANIDDYTSGVVNFPLKDLAIGKHTLLLKAWDVANNSSEVEIEFEVSGEFNINVVSNYPNPISDYTYFTFEHNQSGAVLDAIIEIFDQGGRRVDYITTEVGSDGLVSNPIRWDTNETNIYLMNGIYVYRVFAQNSDGVIASKSGKMLVAH